MRIAFVNATKRWGGVKTWMLEFAHLLSQQGHDIFIYGRQIEFINYAKKHIGHGEIISFGPDLNPRLILYFREQFQLHQVNVVIVNIEKELSTAGIAAKLLNIPVVQRIGLPHDIPYRLKTRIIHNVIKPFFLCPCEYISVGFKESLPYIDPQQVKVILNGRKATQEAINVHSPRRFICTQQLEPNKAHTVLLEAFSTINDNFELHIWGTGSIEESLKAFSHHLGLNGKVFFHGFSVDIFTKLKEGDIFLLASMSEGLPNTLIEAMATGLLPIVRLVGGVSEVLSKELQEWALPYEANTEDFKSYIMKALALSKHELMVLREKAREACRCFFDIDIQAAKLEEWLLTIIKNYKKVL